MIYGIKIKVGMFMKLKKNYDFIFMRIACFFKFQNQKRNKYF